MIVTPLIIWFLAPLVIGGVAGYLGGYALAKLVEYVIRIRHLSLKNLREQNQKKKKEFSKIIGENLNNQDKYNKISLSEEKQFISKEKGEIYSGNIDKEGNLTNVALIEYESIDSSLDKQLNELPNDKVLLI